MKDLPVSLPKEPDSEPTKKELAELDRGMKELADFRYKGQQLVKIIPIKKPPPHSDETAKYQITINYELAAEFDEGIRAALARKRGGK